jgi:bifunctional DNase/RNase
VICDLVGDIYHARLIIEAENEIMERKIIELDARPSDCIALAVRCRAPLYVASKLWNNLEDMSTELANLRNSQDP